MTSHPYSTVLVVFFFSPSWYIMPLSQNVLFVTTFLKVVVSTVAVNTMDFSKICVLYYAYDNKINTLLTSLVLMPLYK